ncbi:MAG: choice-of-anchor D domain-containing protein [Terriglobia bacterium]
MSVAPSHHRKWQHSWGSWVRGVLFVGLLFPLMLRGQATNSPASSKLTTLLASLARAVPQEVGPVTGPLGPTAPMESVKPLSVEVLPKPVRDAMHGRLLRINSRDEVQVYILMAVTEANLSRLRSTGVTIEITDPAHQRVQARIPVSRLQAVADLPFVNFVRLPSYGVHLTGSVDTEGDTILLASQARQKLGVDGTGVRVGVISDGLKGIFATGCTTCPGVANGPISTGDLPSATGSRNSSGTLISSSGGITGTPFPSGGDLEGLPPASPPCGFAGAGAEGTALLEIVHDIAPGAQLSFANFSTSMDFQNAVNFLASSNDVVVDDIGFFGGPYDGTSTVSANTANALNSQSNPIRAYVTSVGNGSPNHYLGTYTDSGTDGFSRTGEHGDLQLFQASAQTADVLSEGPQTANKIELPTNGEVVIFLNWNDTFGSSTNDYDLFLVSESTGAVVSGTMGVNKACFGPQDPVECLEYTNDGAQGFFDILIQNRGNAAAARTLNMYAFTPECAQAGLVSLGTGHAKVAYNTIGQSVVGESDAGGSPVSVTSVGAICSASTKAATTRPTDASCADTTNSTIEYFSSQGPTLDGRLKPEISGIDGVSITGAGQFENPFFGTSAAAPHLAGIGALLLQAAPCLLNGANGAVDDATARADLRSLILNNAAPLQDSSGTVPNQTFGYGRADALASAQQTLPAFGGPSTVTISGNTPSGASLTAAQLGFSDPQTCPLTTLSWSGGCGTGPGSAMSCPFGRNNVSVMASNNGVSFSPAANVEIVVSNFSMGTAPAAPGSGAVKAGQSATYTVTVTRQGGAFSNAITLACASSTLPSGASCSFKPAVVTPGSSAAQSTLTISTTGSAAAPPGLPALPVPPLDTTPWRRLLQWSRFAQRPGGIPLAFWLGVATLILLGWPVVRQGVRWGVRPARPASAGRLAAFGAASMTAALVALQLSCGGGSSNSPPPPAPSVSLSPSSLSFSTQIVGTTSAAQGVTLSNTGNAALSISGIAASGDFAQSDTCGSSVGAAASCTINVTFTPTQGGSRNGTLSVTDNAGGSPQSVGLSGPGQVPTPAGNYAIGITGTSGTLVQSSTATLVVQ